MVFTGQNVEEYACWLLTCKKTARTARPSGCSLASWKEEYLSQFQCTRCTCKMPHTTFVSLQINTPNLISTSNCRVAEGNRKWSLANLRFKNGLPFLGQHLMILQMVRDYLCGIGLFVDSVFWSTVVFVSPVEVKLLQQVFVSQGSSTDVCIQWKRLCLKRNKPNLSWFLGIFACLSKRPVTSARIRVHTHTNPCPECWLDNHDPCSKQAAQTQKKSCEVSAAETQESCNCTVETVRGIS